MDEIDATNRVSRLFGAGQALEAYYAKYEALPSATGERMPKVSWRVRVTEFTDYGLFGSYDTRRSWDDPTNRKVLEKLNFYSGRPFFSDVFVLIGDDTCFSEGNHTLFRPNSNREFLLLIEATGLEIPWTEPRDLLVADIETNLPRIRGAYAYCFNRGVVQLRDDLQIEQLIEVASCKGITKAELQALLKHPLRE